MIKVLHVNFSDLNGGAARAAYRINLGLRKLGVESKMLVLDQCEANPVVINPLKKNAQLATKAKKMISTRMLKLQHSSNLTLHSLNCFSSGLAEWINRSDADIVNLHWLGGEMLSVEEIGRINKPICWTMHDMWPFSGAEHYDDLEAPGRYQKGYFVNNRPNQYSGLDLDAWVWRRKQKAWKGKKFHLISPSHWLADCSEKSVLFAHQQCRVIHNGIDLNRFFPIDRNQARAILSLNSNKRYILFGAVASTSDARKGFHLLMPALKELARDSDFSTNTELLVFGAHAPHTPTDFGFPVHYMGHLHDDVSLALLYSAADVFAAPSMQDNLPNTLVESLACGTPSVAFDVGGVPDLIDHGQTGILVTAFDIGSLAAGIKQVLNGDADMFRNACRIKSEKKFGDTVIAEQYLTLYREILSEVEADYGHSRE